MTKSAIGMMLIIPFGLAAAEPSGVPNFHQVNDRIYRGAQPTPEGFQALAKMGIKTIVDLRREAAQARGEQQVVEALGMKFLSVPMQMGAPTDEQISRVMQELNSNAGPVFVHCHGGRDARAPSSHAIAKPTTLGTVKKRWMRRTWMVCDETPVCGNMFGSSDRFLARALQLCDIALTDWKRSISASSSGLSRNSPAPIIPSTWLADRIPTIAAVTAGCRSVHAIATSPGVRP